jgi:hypothetical protein
MIDMEYIVGMDAGTKGSKAELVTFSVNESGVVEYHKPIPFWMRFKFVKKMILWLTIRKYSKLYRKAKLAKETNEENKANEYFKNRNK